MPTLLRVDASFRTEGSISRTVADTATNAWSVVHPHGTVVRRDLSAAPLPADAWGPAVGAAHTPPEHWSAEQRAARQLVASLADEVIEADILILASPLFNFGVSQYTKVWIDLLIADPRLGPGATALQGKPALLVVTRGGGYGEGTPRHGWDHATAYLERILADNFGMSVETVVAELTLAGTNPAMAHLVGVAAESLTRAHTSAFALASRFAAADRPAA